MNSSCPVTQSCEDFEFEDWTVDFDAEGTSIHEDMVRYYPDGTGYPGYDGIDDIQFTINKITDSDGNELELGEDNYPKVWDEEVKKRLESAINGYLDNHDWDYPEDNGYDLEPEED